MRYLSNVSVNSGSRLRGGFRQRLKLVTFLLVGLTSCGDSGVEPLVIIEPVYDHRDPGRGGTGKIYMGREISQVMGHRGADWLEREQREAEERTDLVLDNLPLTQTSVVADIGSGSGYFSIPIARKVTQGRVYAVDIDPQMNRLLNERMLTARVDNIHTVLATQTDPGLAQESIDVALLVDAYHEFSHPSEVMQRIVAALKPGGQIVIVEYRGEDLRLPILTLHRMSEAQVKTEMAAVGLQWQETINTLPQQHLIIFVKP
ncbi:MAG: precorrin-6B methylase 2 [Gammaproteobacteria bacterium]|jgi:precorrin-6B methylase 2